MPAPSTAAGSDLSPDLRRGNCGRGASILSLQDSRNRPSPARPDLSPCRASLWRDHFRYVRRDYSPHAAGALGGKVCYRDPCCRSCGDQGTFGKCGGVVSAALPRLHDRRWCGRGRDPGRDFVIHGYRRGGHRPRKDRSWTRRITRIFSKHFSSFTLYSSYFLQPH